MTEQLFDLEPVIIGHAWSAGGNRRRWHVATDQDIRRTPRHLYDELNREFGFTIDVAALPDNALCERFFTPEDDGLGQSWSGERCWMNPPYSTLPLWTAKAAVERDALTVGLLPVRTDLEWFHTHVMEAGAEVRFLKGRLRFGDPDGKLESNAPFPSMIVVWS